MDTLYTAVIDNLCFAFYTIITAPFFDASSLIPEPAKPLDPYTE